MRDAGASAQSSRSEVQAPTTRSLGHWQEAPRATVRALGQSPAVWTAVQDFGSALVRTHREVV